MLDIYEIDYTASSNGVNSFEVLMNDELVYETSNFLDAMDFAYNSGYSFNVYTLEAYRREFEEDHNFFPAHGVSY